jgi:hypothetical protein
MQTLSASFVGGSWTKLSRPAGPGLLCCDETALLGGGCDDRCRLVVGFGTASCHVKRIWTKKFYFFTLSCRVSPKSKNDDLFRP